MTLWTAWDYEVALGTERIRDRGYTPEQLEAECGGSGYLSPTLLGLLWDHSDRLDNLLVSTFDVQILGRAYRAYQKPDGGFATLPQGPSRSL